MSDSTPSQSVTEAHDALFSAIEGHRHAAFREDEAALAAYWHEMIDGVADAVRAESRLPSREAALVKALEQIAALRADDEGFTYELGSPEMGRRVGWEDAALIARRVLDDYSQEVPNGE